MGCAESISFNEIHASKQRVALVTTCMTALSAGVMHSMRVSANRSPL